MSVSEHKPTWCIDPCVDPEQSYAAVRKGELDLMCYHCGMLGHTAVWLVTCKPAMVAAMRHGCRCPNCGEYRGGPIREE